MRLFHVLLSLVLVIGLALSAAPTMAQDKSLDELALAAHLQNLRTYNYTYWIGGNLGDPANALANSVVGDTLDDWELLGLNGDDPVTFADITRPVLLNFWASWCPPCRLEFPHLVDVALSPDEYSFDVLFVNTSDTEGDALAWLATQPDEIHTVLDEYDQLAMQTLVDAIPTSLLIDTDGTVLVVHNGLLTPTVTAFLDAVAADPGEGSFVVSADQMTPPPANLQPVEPADVTALTYTEPVEGTISEADTQQAYQFEGHAGEEVTVRMDAQGVTDLDTYLVLMTEEGERLAENDDADDITTNSMITFTLPADGMYTVVATRFLEAEGFAGGDYTLSVTAEGAVPVVDATAEPPVVLPQQGGESTLDYEESGAGTISDENYEDRWTFTGAQGDQITIIMSRAVDELGGLDGYLILEGPDGSKLVEADDSEDSVMPAIENYELPADGTYTIVATRFGFANGFSTGEYSLYLGSGAPPATTEPPTTTTTPENATPITYNSAVNGTISAENFEDWYTFAGTVGDVLTIRMQATSGELDTYLSLMNGEGGELANNDDAENAGESLIENFELPADGAYLIRATRYGYENGPSSGDYTLIIETDAEAIAPPVSSGEAAGELTPGVPVSGSLDPEHTATSYTFSGSAGEIVTIGAYSVMGNGGLLLTLQEPGGAEIGTNAAGVDYYRSYIFNVPLPADGTYTIDMQLQDATTASDYKLIVVKHNPFELSGGSFTPTPGVEIEVVLIWATSADLDLRITVPDDLSRATTIETANDLCEQIASVPIERYTWAEGRPGTYQIYVTYNFNCAGDPSPVTFMLAVVERGEVVSLFSSTLAQEGDTYITQLNFRD